MSRCGAESVGSGLVGGLVVATLLLGAAARLVAQNPTVAARTPADASSDEVLARRITIHLANVPMEQALDSISRVAKVLVEFRLPLLRAHPEAVTINATNERLGIVLERVLNGTTLKLVPGSQGVLTIVPAGVIGNDSTRATGTVTGHIVDSVSGRGLSGVTVKVQGATAGVVTTETGDFTLRGVTAGDQVLTARTFGYRPVARPVTVRENGQTTVRIAMSSVPNVLSGVVTTATGTQRKIEVGNDITTINADSLMKVAPISSVTDILENRVPGLTVLHSSGIPGDPSRIRIRGAGSINENNDPIVIVDGVRVYASQSDSRSASLAPARLGGSAVVDVSQAVVGHTGQYAAPSPLDQIDPGSIETIEVFKGPSASAMYGSDAANGVIVITTKRGQAGPTHWGMNLGTGLTYMPGDWPVNHYRFGYGQSSASTPGTPFCAWYDLSCTEDSVVAYQALNDPNYSTFADHGSMQTGTMTVSGGVPVLRYSLTGSGMGNLGILKMPGLEQQRFSALYGYTMPNWMVRPDHYTTYGGSGQLTATPSATTNLTLISSLYNSAQQRSSLEQAPGQLESRYINPYILGADPLIKNEYERATNNSLTLTSALTANWTPTQKLQLSATGGLNTSQRTDKTYVPYGIYLPGFGENFSNYDSTGSYGVGKGNTLDRTLTVGATMPHQWVSLAVGGNYHGESANDLSVYTNQLAPGISDPSTLPVNTIFPPEQGSTDAATYGWYVEPRLNVASKLFVAPGFRLDGGTASGTNARLTGLPKIDLSYVMVDRQDDPLWGVVSLFRPRLALGMAGTQPSPTEQLRLFNGSTGSKTGGTTTIVVNGVTVPVTFLSALGNTHLQPERSRELEGGFETDLWRNRLELSYTHSSKVRQNAILNIPVAASVLGQIFGSSYNVNIGEIRSTSTELTLSAQVIQTRSIGWNVGMNYSHLNEYVSKLNPGRNAIELYSGYGMETRVAAGYPLWSLWAQPIISYADIDHDGVLEGDEVRYGDSAVYLGQQSPQNTMGFTTNLTLFHGMLGVTASVAYRGGMTQFNQAALTSNGVSQIGNAADASLATQAAIIAAFSRKSAIGLVQTVSTLQFQDLSINYQVPRVILQRLRIPHLQLALQGSNLGQHTNYRGFDPNVNAYSTVSNGTQLTADTGQLPTPRTWSLHFILGN